STRIGASGGLANTNPAGLAVDSAGNIYLAGNIVGPGLITTPGAFQTTASNSGCCYHGFVANLTFALRRVFAALPNYIWFACNSDTVEKAEKGLGEDLPSFLSARLLAFCCFHVSAQHRAKKGWQGSPLLQRGGESPAAWFQDRAADGVVPGRDQRPAA